jgi:hypothetical protein
MLPVPLLPQAERVKALGPIDSQDAIEVIDLVLKKLRPIAFEVNLLPVALEVLIPHPDPIGARDPDQEVGERKTIVPHLEILGPNIDDLGVYE